MNYGAIVLTLLLAGCSSIPYGSDYKENAATINQAITAIKIALGKVEDDLKSSSLQLTDAELTLNGSHIQSVEGEGKVVMVSVEGSRSKISGDKVVIKLKPVRTKALSAAPDASENIGQHLAEAIASTVDGISKAHQGRLPLSVESIEIEQSLTIKKTVGAGGEFKIEVIPLSIGGSGKDETTRGHVLKVVLKPKSS
jgi:hypothetical protein